MSRSPELLTSLWCAIRVPNDLSAIPSEFLQCLIPLCTLLQDLRENYVLRRSCKHLPTATCSHPLHFLQSSSSELNHRPPVQPAVRISNHQHSRLPLSMRQDHPQPSRICSNFKNWLTDHCPTSRHPRRQPDPIHP